MAAHLASSVQPIQHLANGVQVLFQGGAGRAGVARPRKPHLVTILVNSRCSHWAMRSAARVSRERSLHFEGVRPISPGSRVWSWS